jgi:hypothetical protein
MRRWDSGFEISAAGTAYYEARRKHSLLPFLKRLANAPNKKLDSRAANIKHRLRYRCQRNVEMGRKIEIIETHKGYILRDTLPNLAGGAVNAQRNLIVGCENRRDFWMLTQKDANWVNGDNRITFDGTDYRRVVRKTSFHQCPLITCCAMFQTDRWINPGDKTNPFVP